jgi:sigma-E factor negative regulatory protein RseB
MRFLPSLSSALGLAAVLLAPAACAVAAGPALAPVEAKAWLVRIHQAASERNYQGTMVFSAGGSVSSSRIAHYRDGAQRLERIEALDGEMRRVFRHNDVVQTLFPTSRMAVVEQRDPLTPFPSLLQASEDRLVEHYELRSEGADRVAGHDAQVFALRPRDEFRFGQRLWADRLTGLLLRADILGPKEEVLESASFSEVAIGVRAQPDTVIAPMRRLDGYKVLRPAVSRTQLEAEGWSLPSPPAGFRQVSCVRRPLDAGAAEAGQALQAIFSDGLTHVSVFIEAYDAQRHSKPMWTSIGATHTLMRRRDDAWITVMGDVPLPTLKLFMLALERRR